MKKQRLQACQRSCLERGRAEMLIWAHPKVQTPDAEYDPRVRYLSENNWHTWPRVVEQAIVTEYVLDKQWTPHCSTHRRCVQNWPVLTSLSQSRSAPPAMPGGPQVLLRRWGGEGISAPWSSSPTPMLLLLLLLLLSRFSRVRLCATP